MGAYWYISRDKLTALPPSGSLHKRLFARAKVSVGLASVEAGIGPGGDAASLSKSVEVAEQRLRKQGDVAPLSDDVKPPGRPFFDFEGPAVRMILDNSFWTAVAAGDKAVLLAGSAANSIGAKSGQPDFRFSPSADPIGALEDLEKGLPPQRHRGWSSLSYAWAALMTHGTDLIEIDALPRVRGLAIYAGLGPTASGNWPIMDRMAYTVVGSPLFVEQMA